MKATWTSEKIENLSSIEFIKSLKDSINKGVYELMIREYRKEKLEKVLKQIQKINQENDKS